MKAQLIKDEEIKVEREKQAKMEVNKQREKNKSFEQLVNYPPLKR
ncbi:hypothetical protein GCM10012290_02620 [Halolactibacillus alkaliphilus]|nr:DUF3886 domain-containing protein [Halolactibacillus alkaliphilus]GGN64782.1 hypothetical protein GCM10012290_02620 [Halolactibacillus alkaliphilus]SFP13765.1 Protein of unknown function [Halolactibacillus alkaliphilus]